MRNNFSLVLVCLIVLLSTCLPTAYVASYAQQDKDVTVYEAEAAKMTGYAVISENPAASGGAVVTNIGGPMTEIGAVIFNVYAQSDGKYGALIDYIQNGSRNFYISANGGDKINVTELNIEPSYSTSGRRYVELDLKEGDNYVRVFSDEAYAVSIDKLTLFAPAKPVNGIILEQDSAVRTGTKIKRCFGAADGWVISELGNGSTAEFTVRTDSGLYDLTIWYSSPDYRALEISVDSAEAQTIFAPITSESYNVATMSTRLNLSAGTHKISLGNKSAHAPDIDKIVLEKAVPADNTDYVKPKDGISEFGNEFFTVRYNLSTGLADLLYGDRIRVKGFSAMVKQQDQDGTNHIVQSTQYTSREVDVTDVNDGYGSGKIYTVQSVASGRPDMIQKFYVYDSQPYLLTQVELSGSEIIKTNFMAPISASGLDCVDIGKKNDARAIKMPFDNDAWVKYNAEALGGAHSSFWATAVYDNTTRNAVVTGSVDHDTWKTGTGIYADKSLRINFFGAFAGNWSRQYSYDYLPHGSIDGLTVSSPKMFLGYFDDWRDGLEQYGWANAYNVPRLNWDGGVPFGYNSWYGQKEHLNYADSIEAADFVATLNDFRDDQGVVYINLDSYWDSFSDSQLRAFVEKCRANGQKAGIYWSHFVFWATQMKDWGMNIPGEEYHFIDAAIGDGYGGVTIISKDSGSTPLDPTSPAMKARMKYIMEYITELGFEFLKIDFLNYPSVEGTFHDPDIKTGMQAYNYAVSEFIKYVDTDKFFLSYSIAPIFPYAYAHSRRISCDTAANIGETEYMMNSLTYGWWMADSCYTYVDGDHISFASSPKEAKTRYNSSIVSGSLMLLSDAYKGRGMRELTKELTSNKRLNDIARQGVVFRPVEGNTGEWACDLFTRNDGETLYLAAFNFSYINKKRMKVDFERIGLKPDTDYVVEDLWSGESFTVSDNMIVQLMASDSTIYKISPLEGGSK